MHDEDFERLCTDIAERQLGIVRAELKQIKGIAQYGVDVEAFSDEQRSVLVISCKRYQTISATKIVDWGDEFLRHWDGHWKERGVKRFVLAVSVPLNNDELNETLRAEAKRFSKKGIAYEPWGTQKLTTLLREAPDLISAHFPLGWREAIAGYEPQTIAMSAPTDRGLRFEVFETRADLLAEKLTEQTATNIDAALIQLREGKRGALSKLLEDLKENRVAWEALTDAVKARTLRAELVLSLVDGNVDLAASLLNQADAFEPPADRTHLALVKLRKDGAAAAMNALTPPRTQREWELSLAMTLETRGPAEFMAESERDVHWAVTPEVLRLKAIALCVLGRDSDALATARNARDKAASNAAVTFAFGAIHFLQSLSSKAPRQFGDFPNPIHPSLASDTDDAHALRATARQAFDHLIASSDYQVGELEIWQSAVLLCDKRTIHEGVELLGSLVRRAYPHPGAIAWAVAYGVRFNYRKVREGLEALLSGSRANASHLVALMTTLLGERKVSAAKKALERYRSRFQASNDRALLDFWQEQLSPASTTNPWPEFRAAVAALVDGGNSEQLLRAAQHENTPPEQILSAAEHLLRSKRPADADKLRRPLLEIGTADSCELAARAAHAANEFEAARQIISDAAPLQPNGTLPYRLRTLLIDSLRKAGRVGAAIRALESLADETGEQGARLELAKLRISIGDMPGASHELSKLLDTGKFPAQEMLAIASAIRVASPDTAKRLVEVAVAQPLDGSALASAVLLAGQLNLREVAQTLAPIFESKALAGELKTVRVIDSLDEALKQVEESRKALDGARSAWLRGKIPAHVAFDSWPRSFLEVVLGRSIATDVWNSELPPLLRAALSGRALTCLPERARLNVDVSALVIATRLAILDLLSDCFEIWLPADLPFALLQLEETVESSIARSEVLGRVLRRLENAAAFVVEAQPGVPQLSLPPDGEQPNSLYRKILAALAQRGVAVAEPLVKKFKISPSEELADALQLELGAGEAIELEQIGLLEPLLAAAKTSATLATLDNLRDSHAAALAQARKLETLGGAREFAARKLSSGQWRTVAPSESSVVDAGPILRSLLALASEDGPAGSFSWIEDRAASASVRVGNSTPVSIFDVLHSLTAMGKLSKQEALRLQDDLRVHGYAFSQVDIDGAAAHVTLAPLRDGSLVETPELAHLRQHFAAQFELVQHLNPEIKFLSDDAERTEVQHLASLALFAGNVLIRIWSARGSTFAERVQRSEWVWQNLQTGQVGFVPIGGSADAGVRRSIATMTYSSLILNGLQISGERGGFSLERLAEYYRWVFSLLDTAGRNDEKLVETVLNDVASRLATFIGDEEPPKGFAPAELIQAIVSRWPEDWHQEILEVPALREKLKPQYQAIITLPDGTTFSMAEFAEALVSGFDGEARTISTLQNSQAKVSVSGDRALVKLGDDRTYQVGGVEMGVVARDPAAQERALRFAATAYDVLDGELSDLARRLGACGSAEERLTFLQELKDQSYAHRMQLVRDALANSARVGAHLFAPPSPTLILRFLHMDASSLDFSEAFWRCSKERGMNEGLKRFAGLPTLPLEPSADLLALRPGATGSKPPSPMYALRIAVADRFRDDAKAEEGTLNFVEAVKEQSALFLAVLKWSARLALQTPEWRDLSSELRQSLLWVHADLIVGCLMVGGGKVTELQSYFDAQDRADPWQYMGGLGEAIAEIAPFDHLVAFQTWLGAKFFEVGHEARLSTDALSKFRDLVATRHGDYWRPHFVTVVGSCPASEFQPSVAIGKLRDAGIFTDTDNAAYFRGDIWVALATHALANPVHNELGVLPFFRVRGLSHDELAQATAIAIPYFRGRNFPWDSDEYQVWTSYIGGLLGRRNARDEFSSFLTRTTYVARMSGDVPGRDRCIASLAEAAFNFAVHCPASPKERLATTLFGLDVVSAIWPDAREQIRELAAILSRYVPADEAAELGDFHLRLRKLP